MRTNEKKPRPEHDDFKLGQGYGSAEKGSEASQHVNKSQYGDNPLPKSGGGYEKTGSIQPKDEEESFTQKEYQTSMDQQSKANKIKAAKDNR